MVASKVSFFPNLLGENFLKFVRGGRNIQWMRGVYNIGPQKLFLFLTYFVYSRYTLFLSQNLFKLSQLVLKWPWSCRSNLQKCLEHLNLAKIIKWKFKFYVKQKELPQILHSKGFFLTYHEDSQKYLKENAFSLLVQLKQEHTKFFPPWRVVWTALVESV